MYPEIDSCPAIPYDLLTPRHFLYDLIYNPPETRFLAMGRKMGAVTVNGQLMLQLQAEKSWELWNADK
jgi:shikimate dehydrogenase